MSKTQSHGLSRPNAALKQEVEIPRSIRLCSSAHCAIRCRYRNVGDRQFLSGIVVTNDHCALDSRCSGAPAMHANCERNRHCARNDCDDRPDKHLSPLHFSSTSVTPCIAQKRGFVSHSEARLRVTASLSFFWSKLPTHRGFFYHFANINSGERVWD